MPKLVLNYWVDGNDLDESFREIEISQKEYDDFRAFENDEEIWPLELRMTCDFIARSVILLDINDVPTELYVTDGKHEVVVFEF